MVTLEWTMRDLNRSFHTCFPELWSTDPNDVERGGVCTDVNVEYWKGMFEQYERALALNEHGIWFQFHQEAHEMTWGEVCKPFTEERVIFTLKMMDLFFNWLVQRPTVNILTATPAIELYNQLSPSNTQPMYVPYAWVPVPKSLDFWRQVRERKDYAGQIHKSHRIPVDYLWTYLTFVNDADTVQAMSNPPWMDSFFYYDGEVQLIFDINHSQPIAIFNYLNYEPSNELLDMKEEGGGAPGYFLEPMIPIPKISFKPSQLIIEVDNPRSKETPYGVFLWKQSFPDIFAFFDQSNNFSSTVKYKKSADQGIFIRWNLQLGHNRLEISD
jgi:hypothetical protein